MSRPRIVCMLLALVTLLVYLPVRHYPFVNYDDGKYVAENPVIQAGLTWAGIKYAFTTLAYVSDWHPLVWLSLMLDCQLFGVNAGWMHLVNVFFHAINAVLLFLLLLRLTCALWQSALVAALFAWHPLRVESVAWVTERKDVLFLFFGLLALMAYVRYAQRQAKVESPRSSAGTALLPLPARGATGDYAWALLFFALGLMSKPMLVTLPFVFLLLDYWPLQRVPVSKSVISMWSRLVWEKWPFFGLAAASCMVTSIAQQRGHADAPQEPWPMQLRLGNAVVACANYLLKSVYPVHLAVIYPMPMEIPTLPMLAAAMTLILTSWLVWRARRQEPYLLTGWLWFLGTLLPVIGLAQVGGGYAAMADRYTYFPQIGLFLGATFCIGHWTAKLRLNPVVMISVAGIVLAGCLILTARQLQYWRDGETLFRHALAVTQANPVAQNNFGTALLQEGRMDEAIAHFQKAVEISPNYADAHINLGVVLTQKGQVNEAITHYQKALQERPNFAIAHNNLGNILLQNGQLDEAITHYQKALAIQPDYAEAYYNLGNALSHKGQVDEAIAHYQKAVAIKPDYVMAHNNLGNILLKNGQVEEAITHYQKALAIQPDYAEAHNNLGNALSQKGQLDEAIAHYHRVLVLDTNSTNCLNNLAWLLATASDPRWRNGGEAVRLAERACQLTQYKEATMLGTLAAAYAEAGRFNDAIATAQKAHDLALAHGEKDIAARNEELLALYQSGRAYHQETKTVP
jgi:Tfp pilus assembly protein PilF